MSELDAAMIEFAEAVRRKSQRERVELVRRSLELAMAKAFRAQGKLVARSLRQGGFELIWAGVQLQTLKLFTAPIEAAVAKALKMGALALIGQTGMKISFNLANPRAVAYLTDYGARLVKGINETTRETLQRLVAQGANEGWSYKRIAGEITQRFEEFAAGKPQEHIASRAHLIAVTETGNAYARGNFIVAQDLSDAGLQMWKSWSTMGDDRVSDGCRANAAEGWIPVGQLHQSGHMHPLRFPGCRCDELYKMKELI
jgi:hypothetical protein